MKYELRNSQGDLVNTIVAELDFVEQYCADNNLTFTKLQDEPPPAAENPEDWYMYSGPFRDRLDEFCGPGTKLAVMSSTDPQVQAIVRDMQDRKWIALKQRRAEIKAGLDLIRSKSIPGVSMSAAQRDQILDTKPREHEVWKGAL